MTHLRRSDVLIDAFLAEGVTDAPDQVFDAVRGEIHRTRQRVVLGRFREPRAATLSRLAIAAGVLVAVGAAVLSPRAAVGPRPAPTLAPSGAIRVLGTQPEETELEPGRWAIQYANVPGAEGQDGPTVVFTIPGPGWQASGAAGVLKQLGYGLEAPGFAVWQIRNRYENGCTERVEPSPAPGNGIDDILSALASQPVVEAGAITSVTIDRHRAKYVELIVPRDLSGCPDGLWLWPGRIARSPNELVRVYAVDVDGVRLTFFLHMPRTATLLNPATTTRDQALLLEMVDSIDIQP